MDKKIEKDIIKCSRCGLCMDVCPVYKAKKTETGSLRGKMLQLLGLIRRELKMNGKIKYNLDLCLFCGKCKKNCPSEINAPLIFAKIKAENLSLLEKILAGPFVFDLKLLALKVLYKIRYPEGRIKGKRKEKEAAVYFEGCASGAMGLTLKSLFKKGKFSCCGLPFFAKGRLDVYEKYREKNLKLIKKYDRVVFDCASCFDAVMNYEGVDKSKLVYFTEYFKNKKLSSKTPTSVTFHKPCHLSMEKFLEIEDILKTIENVRYLRMPEFDECCGFGGDFFTRHIKTANYLSDRKAKNILNACVDVVLTTCPVCLWGLKYGLKNNTGGKISVLDLSQFLQSL